MIDLSAAEAGADATLERRAEVCVVGAGVAGQAVARRLAAAGRSVLLAESGGDDFDDAVQSLADGPNLGLDYYDLEHSRLRLYGGTTAIWGGRCVALDPIDFERRAWVPHSGWPIAYDDLDPYVDEAFAALELRRARSWGDIGLAPPPFDPDLIDAPLWTFDAKGERFTDMADLAHPKIEIALNATLTRIESETNGEVSGLLFQSLNGRRMRVVARDYVLAAGGIETPRLMLACGADRPDGIGNGEGLVGRYFMEHPHARGGRILPARDDVAGLRAVLSLSNKKLYSGGRRYAASYRPSERVQREEGLLNSSLSIDIRRHEDGRGFGPLEVIKGLKKIVPAKRGARRFYWFGKQQLVRILPRSSSAFSAHLLRAQSGAKGVYAVIRAEQAPNPESRVVLTDERDALGVRRAGLDWRMTDLDRRSIAGLMDVMDRELRRLGIGRVEPSSWLSEEAPWRFDPLISSHSHGGYHHIGTTRMGATAREGVVDADCRVFEAPNLYVAGSSVFPTAGWANPTIAIIALAMRLGDHLAKR